ncbi:helix-turn-helix transcriptional regulator [uncultured Tenacibaculum sp.]|uniref:helix-turn-helix transcriptional regulator n=1 Tax=uncultured Tenacibaculum sp. TaxID=174713 RepID=UPI0034480AA2
MNSEAFITRLKIILEYYNLTSSTFADTIEVQRSSMSHLMSGRNKPSLDFVLKIVDKFPDVDLYWLLNGEGNFPKKNVDITIEQKKEVLEKSKNTTPSLFTHSEPTSKEIPNTKLSESAKKLIKVVLLYNDGTFEEFKQ